MRFPDRSVIGSVTIEGAGEFRVVLERAESVDRSIKALHLAEDDPDEPEPDVRSDPYPVHPDDPQPEEAA